MKTDSFDYTLPQELIAQRPLEPRDSARLLVLERATGDIRHKVFREIGEFLRRGDLLVANESRVLPVRLIGYKVPTRGRVEVLLLRPVPQPEEAAGEPAVWEGLVSPGRRVQDGSILGFGEDADGRPLLEAEVVARTEGGGRILRFNSPPRQWLATLGEMPLPPYIHEKLADPERYQTVYAREEGSAAAPTAGLHFTRQLINQLEQQGVGFARVVLHVGLDTFRPVHEEKIEDHPMHREWYSLPAETAEAINRARRSGGRIIAVGTTSVRVLETAGHNQKIDLGERGKEVQKAEGWSQLFLKPGDRFTLVDGMITNFHLPRTTLLMLVSAFAGQELIMKAYGEAIEERYRFYSFGDATLIL
ncbi:MAG: tRNA preQ1(34) S-adenosylmethionine ribosyltransferase-isomerase QueA [Chloroflexota bacterium]|nr:tRNA preQ1(34) S-adenosylmethionine ribosyltransferase-isomerase QueA [Chloroflexota bacterium]